MKVLCFSFDTVMESIIDEINQMKLCGERNIFGCNLLEEVVGNDLCMTRRFGSCKNPLFSRRNGILGAGIYDSLQSGIKLAEIHFHFLSQILYFV